MTDDTRALVHKTSIANATIAVVLSPIPLVDELILMPVFGVLGARIAKRHQVAKGKTPWRPMMKSAAVGLVARALVNVTVAAVPGVSAAVGAATAVALTEILGEHFDTACADPEHAKALAVREVVDMLKRAVLQKNPQVAKAAM
jgi:uncharacterized protein (DUF697 family)